MKLTEWYPADVKPVHVGVYEVRNSRPLHYRAQGRLLGRYRYWDGNNWMTAAPDDIWHGPSIMGTHDTHQWRGLAQDPNA